MSSSLQDYLETVLVLAENLGTVRITDIAEKLQVKKASVVQAMKTLKKMGLVRQEPYGTVELTSSGRKLAITVTNRHAILRTFLVEVLGVESHIAEKDACLMEHVVSLHTIEKITTFLEKLGYEGSFPQEGEVMWMKNTKTLDQLRIGEKGKVLRVVAQEQIRQRIFEMGVTPGTEIEVRGLAPLGDPMEIGVKGYSLSLRKNEAVMIFVEVKEP